MAILYEVFEGQAQRERDMCFRHPWFNMVYNYVIAVVTICLFASLAWWGYTIHIDGIRETAKAEGVQLATDQYQADADAKAQAAAEQAKSKEEELNRWATAGAKLLYGMQGIVEKYGYDESDLETYIRCVYNRYLYGNKLTPIDVIIATPKQFDPYNENNRPLDKDYIFCLKLFTEWESQERLPCDPSYRFAEFTEHGIYLKTDVDVDGYAPRWHA